MSVLERMARLLPGRAEHRASVDDAINAALASITAGGVTPAASATAAVEACVRAVSAPYALANVTGIGQTVTGPLLVDVARGLMERGNWVAALDVDMEAGALILRPAGAHQVAGTSRQLIYRLELPTPVGQPEILRRLSGDVIHVRINADPMTPWQGIAPWKRAKVSADLAAYIERQLIQDTGTPHAYVLPMPYGASPLSMTAAKRAVDRGKGGLTLLETTKSGWGQGEQAAPQSDWKVNRLAGTPPQTTIDLRGPVSQSIQQAFGIPAGYFSGDGNSHREARRTMFLDAIEPLSRTIAAELSLKLETTITIDHSESQYRDWQRLSRALGALVQAGYTPDAAATLLGID